MRYQMHNAHFLRNCPENRRILINTFKCTWEDICNFTGDAVPDQPWPHENKNAAITDRLNDPSNQFNSIIFREAMVRISIYAACSAVAIFAYYQL